MILIGLLLGMVGTDMTTGAQRLTFGYVELFDGIAGAVAMLAGVPGISAAPFASL